MTINMWTAFKDGGFVFGNYFLLQTLDITSAIVLCQLIAEYNFANNNGLAYKEYFLIDSLRLQKVLGIAEDELFEVINYLKSLGVITCLNAFMENSFLVIIHEDNIVQLLNEQKEMTAYPKWDWKLKEAQNPIKQNSFCPVLKEIINTISNFKIPTVVFVITNILILEYLEEGYELKVSENLFCKLEGILNNPNFTPMDFFFFIKRELEQLKLSYNEIPFDGKNVD